MTFRAVLAGCGSMSKGWLSALAENPILVGQVKVVGLVDVDRAAAEARAKEFDLSSARIGDDLEAMLAEIKPNLLFDVAIPGARADIVSTGLRHGCHVLSEKPMATTLAEGQALIEKAQAAGRVYAIVQNRRFISGVRRIQQFIESGAIGELTALHCDFFIGAHFGGFRDEMENVLLLDMAIHTFDAARYMSGKAPLAVYCHENNPKGSWYAHGAAANAIFELDDNVTFTYCGSWCAEGATTSWESAWRIIGTKGTLVWDGAEDFKAERVAGETGFLHALEPVEVPTLPSDTKTQGHASVIAEFLDALRTGRQPETDANDNINSLAMVFGAIDSARMRRRVEIKIQESV